MPKLRGYVKGYGFTGGKAGADGFEGDPFDKDPHECSNCEDGIDMTDVEGHYTGICAKCRRKHPDDYKEALESEF